MIRNLLAAVIFGLLTTFAFAQDSPKITEKLLTVKCINSITLMNWLKDDGFQMMIRSDLIEDPNELHAVYISDENRMIFVVFPTPAVGCVIDSYKGEVLEPPEDRHEH